MTKETFDIEQKAVIVQVTVEVDGLVNRLDFIVDTGSYETLLCEKTIRMIGYTPVDSIEDVQIQTVSGSGKAYRYEIEKISALGVCWRNFKVISHQMPSGSGSHGLLGLDFFKNTRLTIDFDDEEIIVEHKNPQPMK